MGTGGTSASFSARENDGSGSSDRQRNDPVPRGRTRTDDRAGLRKIDGAEGRSHQRIKAVHGRQGQDHRRPCSLRPERVVDLQQRSRRHREARTAR